MESDNNMSIHKDENILWPKGRMRKKLISKFGSNRPPQLIFGRKQYDYNQSN